MEKLFVIKIGGNVLDEGHVLDQFLDAFAGVDGHRILIHGGGKIATRIGDSLGIRSKYIDGRRITDEATRDLVTMVYGGLVNKQIVSSLQRRHCNAVGLTGADGNVIPAQRRPVKEVDYGFVGDVRAESVNVAWLKSLLDGGLVPVFAPLTHSNGVMLNTNADTIASVLAVALSAHYQVRLIYCFEKQGVLRDVNDDSSVVQHMSRNVYTQLLENKALAAGILPKLDNAFEAIRSGVGEVLIGHAGDLVRNTGKDTAGTLITA